MKNRLKIDKKDKIKSQHNQCLTLQTKFDKKLQKQSFQIYQPFINLYKQMIVQRTTIEYAYLQFSQTLKRYFSQKSKRIQWNKQSQQFWNAQQPSYKGVLLGHQQLNSIDVAFSKKFLEKILIKRSLSTLDNVLDCGAGVGRVSKQVLSHYSKSIDILQQNQRFVNVSKTLLQQVRIANFYNNTIQDFNFQSYYSCIWIQWTLTHLREQDTVNFLTKARQKLTKNGFVIVKENITEDKKIVDRFDSTIVRTDSSWKRLFYESKFKILQSQFQEPWPEDMQKVKMYALV